MFNLFEYSSNLSISAAKPQNPISQALIVKSKFTILQTQIQFLLARVNYCIYCNIVIPLQLGVSKYIFLCIPHHLEEYIWIIPKYTTTSFKEFLNFKPWKRLAFNKNLTLDYILVLVQLALSLPSPDGWNC